jgi:hypothetical protein
MRQRIFPTNSLLNHTTLVSLSLATATRKLYGIHQPTIDKPDQYDNLSRALDCACAAWRYISALFRFILALIEPCILLRSGMMISSETLLSDHQATTTRKLYGNDRLPIKQSRPDTTIFLMPRTMLALPGVQHQHYFISALFELRTQFLPSMRLLVNAGI